MSNPLKHDLVRTLIPSPGSSGFNKYGPIHQDAIYRCKHCGKVLAAGPVTSGLLLLQLLKVENSPCYGKIEVRTLEDPQA